MGGRDQVCRNQGAVVSALHILSGGAANGLVAALQPEFERSTGARIIGTFGAVGAMKAKVLAGEPADMLILTPPLIAELITSGHVEKGPAQTIGVVRTGIAVRAKDRVPAIADATGLRAAVLEADAIFMPDPTLATAGIHIAKMIANLGLSASVKSRLQIFPNGQSAMAAMAVSPFIRPIGLTQITEIFNTPGVTLAGPLPKAYELATVYTIALASRGARRDLAQTFAAMLTGESAADTRRRCGFDVT